MTETSAPVMGTGVNIPETNYSYTFGYNAADKITSFPDPTSGMNDSYMVNADNQFTSTGFSYDGQGGGTGYDDPLGLFGTGTNAFDPEERLTSDPALNLSNVYDGDGMRGIETVGSSNTYFLYDESGHPLVEETYSGSTATMSAVNAFGADGWRERWEYPQVYGYSFDPQGTLVSRGTYVSFGPYATNDTAVYGAYGDLRADFRYGNNTETNYRDPVGFEGQYGYYGEFLAPVYTTGTAGRVPHYISLLTHRYYSPGTGEFINRDPIGTAGGENLYGYAGDNPVNGVDPSGNDSSGVGHHYVPRAAVFGQYKNSNPAIYKMFNNDTSGLTDPPHGNSRAHIEYGDAVQDLWGQFVKSKGGNANKLTEADAEEFINIVKNSADSRIESFLGEVTKGVAAKSAMKAVAPAVPTEESPGSEGTGSLNDGFGGAMTALNAIQIWLDYGPVLKYSVDSKNPANQKAMEKWMNAHPNDPITLFNEVPARFKE